MTPIYLTDYRDTYTAALRAIAARPEDDTERLRLADWLEEHAGTARETCATCEGDGKDKWRADCGTSVVELRLLSKCRTCDGHGSRWVLNGCGERAEFIRVQCELVQMHTEEDDGCDDCRHRHELRKREQELWDKHKTEWFGERDFILWLPDQVSDEDYQYPELAHAVIRRGFIATVRGPLVSLVGDGRTPGALERTGPELLVVTRADVSDCKPEFTAEYAWWYFTDKRRTHYQPYPRHWLPLWLADHFGPAVERDSYNPDEKHITLSDPDAARAALSQSILTLARRRAGLEQIPPNERVKT